MLKEENDYKLPLYSHLLKQCNVKPYKILLIFIINESAQMLLFETKFYDISQCISGKIPISD